MWLLDETLLSAQQCMGNSNFHVVFLCGFKLLIVALNMSSNRPIPTHPFHIRKNRTSSRSFIHLSLASKPHTVSHSHRRSSLLHQYHEDRRSIPHEQPERARSPYILIASHLLVSASRLGFPSPTAIHQMNHAFHSTSIHLLAYNALCSQLVAVCYLTNVSAPAPAPAAAPLHEQKKPPSCHNQLTNLCTTRHVEASSKHQLSTVSKRERRLSVSVKAVPSF
jgi:hypothetical protein